MEPNKKDAIKVTGKVLELGRIVSVETRRGISKKQVVVILQNEEFQNLAAVTVWNDVAGTIKIGDLITALINIQAWKYRGHWNNTLSAWSVINHSAKTKKVHTDEK